MNDEPDEMGLPPVYYAPSSGFTDFMCCHCNKRNKITLEFKAEKKHEKK